MCMWFDDTKSKILLRHKVTRYRVSAIVRSVYLLIYFIVTDALLYCLCIQYSLLYISCRFNAQPLRQSYSLTKEDLLNTWEAINALLRFIDTSDGNSVRSLPVQHHLWCLLILNLHKQSSVLINVDSEYIAWYFCFNRVILFLLLQATTQWLSWPLSQGKPYTNIPIFPSKCESYFVFCLLGYLAHVQQRRHLLQWPQRSSQQLSDGLKIINNDTTDSIDNRQKT